MIFGSLATLILGLCPSHPSPQKTSGVLLWSSACCPRVCFLCKNVCVMRRRVEAGGCLFFCRSVTHSMEPVPPNTHTHKLYRQQTQPITIFHHQEHGSQITPPWYIPNPLLDGISAGFVTFTAIYWRVTELFLLSILSTLPTASFLGGGGG